MRNFIMLFIVLFVTSTNDAKCAQIHLTEEIHGIPSYISNMYTCGHWKRNHQEGYYRVIYVSFYAGNSLLYVQWLGGPLYEERVLHTLSIDEFNRDDHYSTTFEKPECIENNKGISFLIDVSDGNKGANRKVKLDIKHEFGKYTYKDTALP